MPPTRVIFLLAMLGAAAPAFAQQAEPPPPLTLSSPAFADGGVIPDKYTRASATPVSPALAWTGAPAGTQSFTLILHDPDTAPQKNSADVLHWLAFDIPATAGGLPENVPTTPTLADGTVQSKSSGGTAGFMGPGARGNVYHHYVFELFALDTKLALGPDATREQVLGAMNGHVIAKTAYTARFHR